VCVCVCVCVLGECFGYTSLGHLQRERVCVCVFECWVNVLDILHLAIYRERERESVCVCVFECLVNVLDIPHLAT